MQLTLKGLDARAEWETAGIALPTYDVSSVAAKTKEAPVWVHFGIGNIFRIFLGGIADTLIRKGELDRGITCVETFDFDIVDQVYTPHDNLTLAVTLQNDGTTDKRVLGSLAEAIGTRPGNTAAKTRLTEIFRDPGLQLVTFTITEKGYALRGTDGSYLPPVREDLAKGPEHTVSCMGIVTAMLYARFRAGAAPLALVSMDNVSRNGEKLRDAVLEIASAWTQNGLAEPAFLPYVSDESRISFPWTMIDKITPRPGDAVLAALEADGVEGMQPIVTSRETYIAPFVNAEGPQYLVVEDRFPNGRPSLEKAGVYMTDRDTVNKSERMKVTACLNPIHTAVGPYAVLLGYEMFADGITDPELSRLATLVGYSEGLPVAPDPGILSPKAFLEEVLHERFPNRYLGDTSQRICTDASMGMAFRFGETIKAYVERDGTAESLNGIPLAIAGWLRYLLAIDDNGNTYPLAPDPLKEEFRAQMADITLGDPDSLNDQLKPILSYAGVFGTDLYRAGIGEQIETIFREELAGPGAVRATLKERIPS